MTIEQGLLDNLAQLTHCAYLSDLRQETEKRVLSRAVQGLNPESYSLGEWNAAVSYITGQPHRFASPHEAWEYLQGRTGVE